MLRRRQGKRSEINAAPGESLLWRIGERLRDGLEAARWPLERAGWAAEERLLWPLQERAAALPTPGRPRAASALAAVALLAAAVGAVSLTGGNSAEEPPAPVAVAPLAAPAPAPAEEPDGPALEGVPPSFGSGGVAAAKGSGAAASDSGAAASDSKLATADAGSSEDGAGASAAVPGDDAEAASATSSSEKPVPAGPAAMKVARRFSEAFVLYEIGKRPASAMSVFVETATPRLATALAERPPRQPAAVDVPKARVLNLVPGPRRGKAYTISASLLRVGVTSELRMQMKKQAGTWVVTDVRG